MQNVVVKNGGKESQNQNRTGWYKSMTGVVAGVVERRVW